MAQASIARPGFLDRLGDRVIVTDRTGGDLEVLRLRPEVTAGAAFEASLKARAEQLAAFEHRGTARVRGISRLPGADGRLAIVSDVAKGWRLSEVLQAAEHEARLIHTSTVLFLLRQVSSVVAALQAAAPDIGHGALGPERVVLNAAGRVLVVEYVLGAALEHLPALPCDRMWKEYRLAVPADGGSPRFGPTTDVLQLGIIALSLVHNRLLKRDEYPARLGELLDTATESQVTGARQPLGRILRDWLEHALGLAKDAAGWTMADAQRGLDWIVSSEGGYFSTPVGLEPLLQSVERFFTVPPAEAAANVGKDSEPSVAAAPAPPEPATPPAVPTAPAVAEPTVPAVAAPTPASSHSTTVRVRPRAEHASTTSPAALAPALPPAMPVEDEQDGRPGVLTLVKPVSGVPAALPPATELIARTLEDRDQGDGASITRGETPPADALIVTSSLLAEFAGERVVDQSPVSADVAPELTASGPSLWPPSAVDAPVDAPGGVAPVADMLASDRPAGRRRSGWNGEAWKSRSTERQSSGTRASVSNSGSVESHTNSGPAPRATATTQLARSGGATAVAAALKPRDLSPVPEPVAASDRPPVKDRAPSPSSALRPAPAVATPNTTEVTARIVRNSGTVAATVSARPMFGFAAEEAGEESASAAGVTRGRRRKSNLVWPAAAAVVILCGGGFAAWKLVTPAGKPAVAPDTAARGTTTESQPPVTQPVPPAQPPVTQSLPSAARASVPAPVAEPEATPVNGTFQLVTPIVVSVSEKGQALGTSAAPIALAAGPHVLDFVSEELGYRATRSIEVRAGRTTRAELALPSGSVNINATPWAEVLVDGQRVGETPLGNVQLTIGSHEVRFRHPQLGERVRTVVVTTGAPGRLSVDMKQ